MEEENTQNKPNEMTESEEIQPEEDISLSDAITGVITEPGDTFESIKKSSKKNYWLIPILILIVIGIVSRFLAMNDEELYSEMKSKQTEAVKKRMDEAVKNGQMSQEQANERMEQIDKGFGKSSPIFIVSLTLGPIIVIFLFLFVKGLIFLGVLKIFKGVASYMQIITVLGLTSIIDSLQTVVDTVLAIVTGRILANIGPILIFSKESLNDTMSTLLGHLDLFNFWYMIVIGIGFAKMSNLKSSQTIPTVFALWIVWICLTTFLKLPFFGG